MNPRRLIDLSNSIYIYGQAIAALLKDYSMANVTNGRLVQKYLTRRNYTSISGSPVFIDELGEKIDGFVVSWMNASDTILQGVLARFVCSGQNSITPCCIGKFYILIQWSIFRTFTLSLPWTSP